MQQAIQSVQDQDYEDIEHLIVIDGHEREEKARAVLEKVEFKKARSRVLCLPYVTGKKFKGHRIYGMSCYLTNGDYIAYLDQDNWWESNHISLLVELVYEYQVDWAYSLRKILSESGQFITYDDCQSLGQWQAFDGAYHHVDTNCYFLKKKLAISHSPIWYRPSREHMSSRLESPDIVLCNTLVKTSPNFKTPGAYTVNYRLGSTAISAKPRFFLLGNSIMADRYPDGFPWRQEIIGVDCS